MVDLTDYNFKPLTGKVIKPEESFINFYVDECFESERTVRSTRIIRRILDPKYKKSDLNKVTTEHCQHLELEEHDRLLALLRNFEDMFDGTLGTWNTKPVDL